MSEGWAIFAAVAVAHALGVASPGPDFAIVIRQTLAHGRRIGVVTALGIGSGILFHVAWGMFGLAWAVERFPALLDVLRYGGAGFLLWMGLQALRSKPQSSPSDSPESPKDVASVSAAYAVGLATNLLNPKAFLFFVALCSSVVTAGASPLLRLALGLWMALATAGWFGFVAFTVGHRAVRIRLSAHAHRIDHVMGCLLIGLAAAVAFSKDL
jgi:threonine/homoserine/homoserine lactone efflux protein